MNPCLLTAAAAIVPAADALPLPAPAVVLDILLQLTFLLHLLAMNALVGSLMITLYARLRGPADAGRWTDLADTLARVTPMLVAATVTLGVAPLLFLQTLMGQFFFTSSILMGWGWFSIVVVLIFAYYGTYLQSFRGPDLGRARTPLLAVTLLLFLWVGFMFANNTSLMAAVGSWAGKYFTDPRGLHLNLGDPTLAPRYLHAMIGAPAVAGLMLALWGTARSERGDASGAAMRQTGLGAFTFLTAVNFGFGLWYLLALPRPVLRNFMGNDVAATVLLTVGVAGAVAMVVLGALSLRPGSRLRLGTPVVVTLAVMAAMVAIRHLVRRAVLAESYRPDTFAVQPQNLNMMIFAVLLVAGLGVLVWMVRSLQKAWSA